MQEENAFAIDDVLPSWFANAIQKFLSVPAPAFQLTRSDATHIQVVAAAPPDAAAIAIAGKWRWNEATVTRAHPGGVAGNYDIYATAANNKISGAGVDETNRAFSLRIVTAGSTPTIEAGVVDIYRKVGTLTWTGTAISSVTQTLGHRSDVVFPVGPWLSISTTTKPVGGEYIELHPSEGPIVLPAPATAPNKVIGALNTFTEGGLEVSCPTGEIWTIGKSLLLLPGESVVLLSDGSSWIVQSLRRRTQGQGGEVSYGFNEAHVPSATRHVLVNLRVRSNRQPPTLEHQVFVDGVQIARSAIQGEEGARDFNYSFITAPGEAWQVNTAGGFTVLVASYRVLGIG